MMIVRSKIIYLCITLGICFYGKQSLASFYDYKDVNKKELSNIKDELTEKVDNNLREYLGGDFRYGLLLNLNTIPLKAGDVNTTGQSVDIGYLYVPGVQNNNLRIDHFKLSSVKIRLFLYDKVKQKTLDNIKNIIKSAIPKIRTNIAIKLYTDPPIEPPIALPEKVLPPKTLGDYIADNFSYFMIFLAILIVTVAMLVGFFVFSNTIKTSVDLIAQSMQSAKLHLKDEQIQSESDEKVKVKNDDIDEDGETSVEMIDISPENFNNQIEEYVETIKRAITSAPHSFSRTINTDSNTLQALRRLIPFLAKSFESIEDVINNDILTKVYNNEDQNAMSDLNYLKWLKSFSENITINGLRNFGYFSNFIKNEYVNELEAEDPELLLKIASKYKKKTPLKIVLDFIEGDIKRKFIEELSIEDWKEIIEEAVPTLEEINTMAEKLVQDIKAAKHDPTYDSEHHADKVIMPSMIELINSKPPGEDDKLIEQIKKISPELMDKISNYVWTPETLNMVPKDYMNSAVSSLDLEDKFLLVVGMPKKISEDIKSLIPNNKSKIVLLHKISQFDKEPNVFVRNNANILCKKFINNLRLDEQNGRFERLSQKTSEKIDSIEDIDVDIDIDKKAA